MAIGLVEEDFAATGQTDWMQIKGGFNISADYTTGTGVGTVLLERSFDGVSAKPAAVETITADFEKIAEAPGEPVYYRLRCSVYTSGTISVRLSY